MVKLFIALSITLISLSPWHANSHDVKSVHITKMHISKNEDAQHFCKYFTPSLHQVQSYFSKAYPVPGKWSIHTYYSPCHSEGTIEYTDGNRGRWILKSSGISIVIWEKSGSTILFYDKNPWYDPFEGSYGENAGV